MYNYMFTCVLLAVITSYSCTETHSRETSILCLSLTSQSKPEQAEPKPLDPQLASEQAVLPSWLAKMNSPKQEKEQAEASQLAVACSPKTRLWQHWEASNFSSA